MERFETHRNHPRAVAQRMLGSLSDADDAIPKVRLRLSRTDISDIENLTGWLTRVVARVWDLADKRLHPFEKASSYPALEPLIGDRVNVDQIQKQWDELLRLARRAARAQ